MTCGTLSLVRASRSAAIVRDAKDDLLVGATSSSVTCLGRSETLLGPSLGLASTVDLASVAEAGVALGDDLSTSEYGAARGAGAV